MADRICEWQRRSARNSASHITVLFGVTDAYLDGSKPAVYSDRMFYVWATRSGYPFLLQAQHGSIGGWKWDQPAMSNTSRDLAFTQSIQHYGSGATSSRLGQVRCP